MTSKKLPRSKHAALPRLSDCTKAFLKDWERLIRSECHAGGDFLLMYRVVSAPMGEAVVFVRCGTHADLFDE